MKSRHFITCAAVGLVMSGIAGATEYTIGTQGATVDLDASWQRKVINRDIGPDQFVHEDGVFAVLLEQFNLLERRSDFESLISTFISGIEAKGNDIELDPELQLVRNGRVSRCTQRLNVTLTGLNLAYQLDVVSRDGLGYLIMTWAEANKALTVSELASQLASAVAFPGPDTEWGRSAEPSTHSFRFDDWVIKLTYRDSVFPQVDDHKPGIYSLTSGDGTIAVHVLMSKLDDDPNEALDTVVEIISDGDEFEELGRTELDLEAGRGLQTLLRKNVSSGGYDVTLGVIPLRDDLCVDLRMVTGGVGSHRDRMWDELVSTVEVVPPAVVDAFPEIEPPPSPAATILNPAARMLLGGSSLIGSTDGWYSTLAAAGDGTVVAVEPRRIVHLVPGAEAEELYATDDWLGGRSLAVRGDDLLITGNADGQISRVVAGDLETIDVAARRMAVAGDQLVLLRRDTDAEMLGYDGLDELLPEQLILRAEDGGERVIAVLDDLSVKLLAADLEGETALVSASERSALGGPMAGLERHLIEIDLDSGRRRDLGEWARIRSLAPGTIDWLVSGTPIDGVAGLYRVAVGADPELLISGGVTGVTLDDEHLVFSVNVCFDDEGERDGTCVYETPLDLVREHGVAFQPLTAETVNRIAEELAKNGASGSPTTRKDVADRVSQASAICERLTGVPLPSAPQAVDHWLRAIMGEQSLTDDAISLLSLVLAETLLDGGAEWVPSPAAVASARINGSGSLGENEFAMALDPIQVIVSTLYQEEGWWDPASSIQKDAEGRTILLGYDHAAIESELAARTDGRVNSALSAGKMGKLEKVLGDHPDNHYLRHRVYQYFAAQDNAAALERIGRQFATQPEPAEEDLRAWFAGRLHQGATGTELDSLISDLRTAIGDHPQEASFYLLLGAAYERSDADLRGALARACYAKAAELVSWGDLSEAATEGITRIDEAQ